MALFGHNSPLIWQPADTQMSEETRTVTGDAEKAGAADANKQLFASLYTELRRLADRELRRYPGAAVSPTTLVHEAYLNLMSRDGVSFDDPGRCLGYVARAMRGLLIDFLRQRGAIKRGAGFHITELNTQIGGENDEDGALSRLSEALDELAVHEPRLAELVDLKYFCGFSFAEIGKLRGISERTVQRDWQKVRLLLFQHIHASAS
jgi:RNA polymerase sigma factor (TIGR02999 family)